MEGDALMKKMNLVVLAALGMTVLTGSVLADEATGDEALKRANKVVERREAVMGLMGWSAGPMVGMIKEQTPYDAGAFTRQARRMAALSEMVDDLFKADVRQFDLHTEAKPELWDEYDDFAKLAQDLVDSSKSLVVASEAGDLDVARKAFTAVADDCKACHDKYKEDDH